MFHNVFMVASLRNGLRRHARDTCPAGSSASKGSGSGVHHVVICVVLIARCVICVLGDSNSGSSWKAKEFVMM